MTRLRRVLACITALALASLAAWSAAPADAADPASESAAAQAVAYLKTQQQSDGGFEVSGFAGFETTDAVLAVAEQAQTGAAWNEDAARDAIDALHAGGSGPTPLDYLENLVATSTDPAVAAKNALFVSVPLGIDPTEFGSVNLVDAMGGCTGTDTLGFNGFLYLVIAQQQLCGSAPAASVATIRDAQQANGGWNFAGDNTGTDIDADTTSAAVMALVATGAGADDPAVHRALVLFADNQQANGSWQAFGADDPNATAMAIFALAAAGFDATSPCWRDTVSPAKVGTAYASPDAWLRSQQITTGTDAGRIQSPNDSFGVNTFATSQTVQALLRSWWPISRAPEQNCTSPEPPPSSTTTTTLPHPPEPAPTVTTAEPATAEPATAKPATAKPATTPVRIQPKFTG
jgi:hypothetical protein